VAIAGLWILVFKDKLPSGRSVSEAADAPPLQSAVGKPLQAQSAHTVESGAQTTIGGLHEAKVFKPRKLRQPVGRRMLGGALLLGGISIPVLIGLALFASMQIELLGYVVFAAFAAAVGAFLGLIGWEL
jgi:hypothetical protein